MGYVCNSRTGKGDLLVSDEFRTEIDGSEQIRRCALSTLDGNRIDLNELYKGSQSPQSFHDPHLTSRVRLS